MPEQPLILPEDIRELASSMARWVVSQLQQIPDQNSRIMSGPTSFTVAELIEDIDQLRPRGLLCLKYMLGADRTLRQHGGSGMADMWPDPDGRLYDSLKQMSDSGALSE
jgi:hypothetical protein